MSPNYWRTVCHTISLLAVLGCGTIVGNPKKPKDPNAPTGATFQVPLVNLEVPDVATIEADPTALALVDPELGGGDRTLLREGARRLARLLTRIDGLAARLNRIIEDDAANIEDGVLRFAGRGAGGRLSGHVGRTDGQDFDFDASVCVEGRPVSYLAWTDDGETQTYELTRDLGFAAEDGEETLHLVTRVRLVKAADGSLQLTQASYGAWDEALFGQDGGGFVEALRAARSPDGAIEITSVSDRFDQPPADGAFDGDLYLVGRLLPDQEEASDASRRFLAEFVGYFKGLAGPAGICRRGFDEGAADLWHPPLLSDGPRFCVGRPLGAKRFESAAQFYATLANLESVGLVSKLDLRPVALDASVTCD